MTQSQLGCGHAVSHQQLCPKLGLSRETLVECKHIPNGPFDVVDCSINVKTSAAMR